MRPTLAAALTLTLGALAGACGGEPPQPRSPDALQPTQALASLPQSALGRIEVRQLDGRPRLTLVSRDGDPAPAIAVTVAADLGPAAATALAAVVEARLRAAGFEVDARVDRSAFRVRMLAWDTARVGLFFAAVAQAFAVPIAAGGPEMALAGERLAALRKTPLDAAELAPVAACTGQLGLAAGERVPDVASPAGAAEVEAWRRAALHTGRTSIAAVGPAPFCAAAASALEQTEGWAVGPPATDGWPTGDATGAYASASLGRRQARVTVAVRVGDAHAAVAAAERLGAPDSPLLARLAALPHPFRAVEIAGVARPRGGCVSVAVEVEQPLGTAVETPTAIAAALVRQEIRAELAGPSGPAVATRQILTAADPREAASRASWWALSGSLSGVPERWAIALGVPASGEPVRGQIGPEINRAITASAAHPAERRIAVEQGQGELWVLLASPCGVSEEGSFDAGLSALAVLTVVQARRHDTDVALEPWITPDGVGVLAHASLRDERESPAELARRVADAAGRTFGGTALSTEAFDVARLAMLEHMEQVSGRHAAAWEAFATAVVPEHPSWLSPFGLWNRVASSGLDAVRLRWQALTAGPLRVAVIGNVDGDQASAAASAAERWLTPRFGERACRTAGSAGGRAGRVDIRLPSGSPLAQALVGAAVPTSGSAGHEMAKLTALALDGGDGLLQRALSAARLAARSSARVVGGGRAAALVIDVRAPADSLTEAVAEVKGLLTRLGQAGPSEADLSRALAMAASRDAEARYSPRQRLIDLWSGAPPGPPAARPSVAAWRDWLASALGESSLVVVEARPE